jgi:hypothetical protein
MPNQSNNWNTPPKLLEIIGNFFNGKIDLDPCSNSGSMVKAFRAYELPYNDGLVKTWHIYEGGRVTNVFFNPPYGPYYLSDDKTRQLSPKEYNNLGKPKEFTRYTIKDWIKKAVQERGIGLIDGIGLVPARGVGNSTWQRLIWPKTDAICFLSKRYPFWDNGKPAANSGTFDLALLYFGNCKGQFEKYFNAYGYVKC